ncbi:hypothetical protein COTS27_01310 [Spirochaetota bacterium]|nr:hypothetical protein COTS27_01310 [Spirochaetota bacterium]
MLFKTLWWVKNLAHLAKLFRSSSYFSHNFILSALVLVFVTIGISKHNSKSRPFHLLVPPLLTAEVPYEASKQPNLSVSSETLTPSLKKIRRPDEFFTQPKKNIPNEPNTSTNSKKNTPPLEANEANFHRTQVFTDTNIALTVNHYTIDPKHPSLPTTSKSLNLATNIPLYISVFTISIDKGYHINSHRPLTASLIPTEIAIDEDNWALKSIYYPPGTVRQLRTPATTSDSTTKPPQAKKIETGTQKPRPATPLISVYENTPHILIAFTQPKIEKLNDNLSSNNPTLPFSYTLSYQICSETFCYPPKEFSYLASLSTAQKVYPPPPPLLLAKFPEIIETSSHFYTAETILTTKTTNAIETKSSPPAYPKLILYLSLAFLGGLLLNFMPCVLPVVYLKLFSLLTLTAKIKDLDKHNLSVAAPRKSMSTPPKKLPVAAANNTSTSSPKIKTVRYALLNFALGICTVFFILTIISITLKLAGSYIGWGFQFQNPIYVFTLICLTWYMGLYLIDVYSLPFFTIAYQEQQAAHSKKEHFLLGMLTALLATPCTAPLLGPAIGYLFSRSWWELALAIHLAGLGLAFPYLISAVMPTRFVSLLIKWTPRPGRWMERLKNGFGFILILVSLWLINILFYLETFREVILTLGVLWCGTGILFFTQSHHYDRYDDYAKAKKNRKDLPDRPNIITSLWNKKSLTSLGIIAVFIITIYTGITLTKPTAAALDVDVPRDEAAKPPSQAEPTSTSYPSTPLNIDTLTAALNSKQIVFIHISAEWCLSCKVNERFVLRTKTVQNLFTTYNVTYLKGDWTQEDAFIAAYLRKNGRAGIPFDAIYTPTGTITILNEILTTNEIKKALTQAAL